MVDRGNQAIREIQLHEEDCSGPSYDGTIHIGTNVAIKLQFYPLPRKKKQLKFYHILKVDLATKRHLKMWHVIAGIAVLAAAGFFGYMLALLQRRVKAMFSSSREVSLVRQYIWE